MEGARGIALLAHEDQWLRCAHDGTALLPGGGVTLDWTADATGLPVWSPWDDGACRPRPEPLRAACPAGLAFDRWCRSWRTRPEEGRLETTDRRGSAVTRWSALRWPTAVAVDRDDRLYVAERSGRSVLVADLASSRTLGRVALDARPVDLAAHGAGSLLLVADPTRLLVLDGRRRPCPGPRVSAPCGYAHLRAARLTVTASGPLLLWREPGGCDSGRPVEAVVADPAGNVLLEVPGATDLAALPDGGLVVARGPGAAFLRYAGPALVEDEPLLAAEYDGGAVDVAPDGRITYTTSSGVRSTQGSFATHRRRGRVTTYRLDAQHYGTRWGRVFLDACLPAGTALSVRAITADEDDVTDPLPPRPPGRGDRPVPHPEQTPTLPSRTALDGAGWLPVVPAEPAGAGMVDPASTWATYEGGVDAPPGRFLWLEVELTGTESTSPRLRALRVERPGHALLRSLPRMYSSAESEAGFLHGFLTAPEGLLHDLDAAADGRARIVDPRTTPDELLPWVASLVGLVPDHRWDETATRELVAALFDLYARRGTQGSLERLLTIVLRRPVRIVERWRLRGLGGPVLGLEPEGLHAPTVLGRARVAGMLGRVTLGASVRVGSSASRSAGSTVAYEQTAHRFSVLVPGRLDKEQRAVVSDLLGRDRPSHTLGEVCELGDGLPVGRLRVGLTAYVGPRRAGVSGNVVGGQRLGRGLRAGAPACGARVGEARVGGVRVG